MGAAADDARDLNDAVAAQIRAALGYRQLTYQALAEMLGVSDMWVGRRLRGDQVMTLRDMERIARALDLTVADLLPRDVRKALGTTRLYRPVTSGSSPDPDRTDEDRPNDGPPAGTKSDPDEPAKRKRRPVRVTKRTPVDLLPAVA